jgi:hypothetical protein
MKMRKYHILYQSMTAFYDMGYVYAPDKATAEREARAKATAFNQKEKCLIKAHETQS